MSYPMETSKQHNHPSNQHDAGFMSGMDFDGFIQDARLPAMGRSADVAEDRQGGGGGAGFNAPGFNTPFPHFFPDLVDNLNLPHREILLPKLNKDSTDLRLVEANSREKLPRNIRTARTIRIHHIGMNLLSMNNQKVIISNKKHLNVHNLYTHLKKGKPNNQGKPTRNITVQR